MLYKDMLRETLFDWMWVSVVHTVLWLLGCRNVLYEIVPDVRKKEMCRGTRLLR